MHILIMTGSWNGALACVQSFGRRKHKISIVNDKYSPNLRSKFVSNVIDRTELDAADPARSLVDLVDRLSIDLVVPISDADSVLVAQAKELAPTVDAFVSSSVASVMVARSRNSTVEMCRRLGIKTPRTKFTTPQAAAADAKEFTFPFFLKISGFSGSNGVFRVQDSSELQAALPKIPSNAEVQIQEEVIGAFLGITGFCFEGRVLGSFSRGTDYHLSHGGTPPYGRRLNTPALDAILAQIAQELKWTGGIDLDLLQDVDGAPTLLEINPRFSGSIVFPLKLGIDLPSYYIAARNKDFSSPTESTLSDADAFISLEEEAAYLARHPRTAFAEAIRFRRENNFVDSSFPEDLRYSISFFFWRIVQFVRFFMRRHFLRGRQLSR